MAALLVFLAACSTTTLDQKVKQKAEDDAKYGAQRMDNLTEEEIEAKDQYEGLGEFKPDEPGAPDIKGKWVYVKTLKNGVESTEDTEPLEGTEVEFGDYRVVTERRGGFSATGLYRWDGSRFVCVSGVYGRFVYIDENNIKRVGNGVEHYFTRQANQSDVPSLDGRWTYSHSIVTNAQEQDDEGRATGTKYTYWLLKDDDEGTAYLLFSEFSEFGVSQSPGVVGTVEEFFDGEVYTNRYYWDGERYVIKGTYEGVPMDTVLELVDEKTLREVGLSADHYYTRN